MIKMRMGGYHNYEHSTVQYSTLPLVFDICILHSLGCLCGSPCIVFICNPTANNNHVLRLKWCCVCNLWISVFLYSICVVWTLAPIIVIKWTEFFAEHLKMTMPSPPLGQLLCLFPVAVVEGLHSMEVKSLHWLFSTQYLKVKEDIHLRLDTRYVGCYCVVYPLLCSCHTPCLLPFGRIWPTVPDNPTVHDTFCLHAYSSICRKSIDCLYLD